MYIAAVCPPNNADTAFLKIKRELFYENSVVSAWALRPMVPFALFEECPEKPVRRALPVLPAGGLCFQSVSRIEKQCCLGSAQCTALCESITDLPIFLNASPKEGRTVGGFSAVPGLHLLDSSEKGGEIAIESAEKKIAELDEAVLAWRRCSLSLFEVNFSEDLWWTEISLEKLWELPLPGELQC